MLLYQNFVIHGKILSEQGTILFDSFVRYVTLIVLVFLEVIYYILM